MTKKLKVDKDVYEALETIKKIYENDAKCLIELHSIEAKWEGSFASLNKLGAYEFAKAILIGYELEKTPEEKLAEWASKNSKNPKSFNIRYVKGTIKSDGTVSWGAVEQTTAFNISDDYAQRPDVVVFNNNLFYILN